LNEKDYYMGIPALVMEIISESTRGKDCIKKMDLYISTGVKEYWIINPLNREVSVYRFEENNTSKNTTYKNLENAASYLFAGFEVSLEKIFG
jgi:Uma2 family endonuclease